MTYEPGLGAPSPPLDTPFAFVHRCERASQRLVNLQECIFRRQDYTQNADALLYSQSNVPEDVVL